MYVSSIRRLALVLCLPTLCVFASCGYSTRQAESMPGGYRRVYVPNAIDAGFDVGSANTLTRVFRALVQGSTVIEHVSAKDAEIVAELKIENTTDAPGVSGNPAPLAPGQTASYAVPKFAMVMAGTLRLYDASGGIVWQSGSVSVSEDYLSGQTQDNTNAVLRVTEDNRRRALERCADDLARLLYTKMLESF